MGIHIHDPVLIGGYRELMSPVEDKTRLENEEIMHDRAFSVVSLHFLLNGEISEDFLL